MLKSGIRKNIILFILMAAGLIGMKRSLLIVSVLSIIVYSLCRPSLQKKKALRNILICISLLVVIAGVFCYSTYGAQALDRLEAIEEDGGSGRIDIYEDLWTEIETNTETEWMIGHGPNAVQQYFSSIFGTMFRSAHNDFLEMIYDFGILGFALYVLLHLLLLVYCIKLKRRRSEYFAPFFSAWIFFFVLSLVSHIIIYPSYPAYILIVIGMIIAAEQRKYSLFQNKFLESNSDLLAGQPEEDWKKGNIG
ncbi:MAG: O-antigen ligase family protein [Victivallaceae bacterium]|nr:O-antigen ligase family protein [Victivallaceae bacterium]